jgi:hypothetical protein
LRAVIEAGASDAAENESLRWMWNEIEYGGNYFGDLPGGGYRSLVGAMAGGINVQLGREVTEVAVSPGGVTVLGADGTSEAGSHAVVTVPLGVLKQDRPRFSPALPPGRSAAIDRLGFGRFEKVAVRFDEPFWRADGLPHMMLFPRAADEPTVWVIGQDAFDLGPTLVFLIFHSAANRAFKTSPTTPSPGSWACLPRRPATRVRHPSPSRPHHGLMILTLRALTAISRPVRSPPTSISSANPSMGGSCSRVSTPRVPGWDTPTAR